MKCDHKEHIILSNWHLNIGSPGYPPGSQQHPVVLRSPINWQSPPLGFFKLNFDGASKGNLGPAGFGAVIRNSDGIINHLLARSLGFDTNNSTELWGLIRGIDLASLLGLNQLIIEGDSQLIISLVIKIIHGSDPAKLYPSWHLLSSLELFKSLLHPGLILIPSHVRRATN